MGGGVAVEVSHDAGDALEVPGRRSRVVRAAPRPPSAAMVRRSGRRGAIVSAALAIAAAPTTTTSSSSSSSSSIGSTTVDAAAAANAAAACPHAHPSEVAAPDHLHGGGGVECEAHGDVEFECALPASQPQIAPVSTGLAVAVAGFAETPVARLQAAPPTATRGRWRRVRTARAALRRWGDGGNGGSGSG